MPAMTRRAALVLAVGRGCAALGCWPANQAAAGRSDSPGLRGDGVSRLHAASSQARTMGTRVRRRSSWIRKTGAVNRAATTGTKSTTCYPCTRAARRGISQTFNACAGGVTSRKRKRKTVRSHRNPGRGEVEGVCRTVVLVSCLPKEKGLQADTANHTMNQTGRGGPGFTLKRKGSRDDNPAKDHTGTKRKAATA